MYVLETTDILNRKVYYKSNWHDTLDVLEATRYTLDDGIKEAKLLKEFGGHYKVVRLGSILAKGE